MRSIPPLLACFLAALLLAVQPGVALANQPRRAPIVQTFWTGNFGFTGMAVSHGRFGASGCGVAYELGPDGEFVLRAFPRPGCWEFIYTKNAGAAFSRDGSELGALLTHGLFPQGFLYVYKVGSPEYTLRHIAGFAALEQDENPDRDVHYGFEGGDNCLRDNGQPLPRWTGSSDTIKFNAVEQVAPSLRHSWLVADSEANTIWKVDANGKPSTFAVLPRVRSRATAEFVATYEYSSCAVGLRYFDEPRPYEIEAGPDKKIYVAGGARLYRVNPRSAAVRTLPYRFDGRVDLAVGRHGQLYVAELGTGQISVIRHGRVRPYVKVPNILAIETDERGQLWAVIQSTYGADYHQVEPGQILKIRHR